MARAFLILACALLLAALVAFASSIRSGSSEAIEFGTVQANQEASNEHLQLARAAPAVAAQRAIAETVERGRLRVRVVGVDGIAPEWWEVQIRGEPSERAPRFEQASWIVGGSYVLARVLGMRDELQTVPEEVRTEHTPLKLMARSFGGFDVGMLMSDEVTVDALTTEVITLVVSRPTVLGVRIDGPRPSGDLHFEVAPVTNIGDAPEHARSPEFMPSVANTSEGEARFNVAPGVAHSIRVTGSKPEDIAEVVAEPIPRGESRGIRITFPAGFADPVPEHYAELALAGRIEFEGDDPPGLWAAVDGGLPISIVVHRGGAFELWHSRAGSVELHAAGGEFGPRFDPETSTYPFGTRDVLLSEITQPAVVSIALRVAPAAADLRIFDAQVTVGRRDGERVRDHAFYVPDSGVVEFDVPALPDMEFLVCASGCRDRRGSLFDSEPPPDGAAIDRTIYLFSGFEREFRIVHCSAQTPVEGAEVAWNGQIVGISGAGGRVRIVLDEWPDSLVVTALGYDAGTWPSRFESAVGSRSVSLCPAD